jgi:hypothetical protein
MNAVVLGLLDREWEAQSGRADHFIVTPRVIEVLELAYAGLVFGGPEFEAWAFDGPAAGIALSNLADAHTPTDVLEALGPADPSPWAQRLLTALSSCEHPVREHHAAESGALALTPAATSPAISANLPTVPPNSPTAPSSSGPLAVPTPPDSPAIPATPGSPTVPAPPDVPSGSTGSACMPVSRPPVRLVRLIGAHLLAAGTGAALATVPEDAMVLGNPATLLGVLAAVGGVWAALLIPARKPARKTPGKSPSKPLRVRRSAPQ